MKNTTPALAYEVYDEQPKGAYRSEEDFLDQLRDLAQELYERQPEGVDFTLEQMEVVVLAFQKENGFTLDRMRQRLLAPGSPYYRRPAPGN